MAQFRGLRSADLRKINGLTRRMIHCENLTQLEQIFTGGVLICVPIDYLAWNVFNRERTKVIYIGSTDQLKQRATGLLDEINGYFTNWHPILSNVGWNGVEKQLATISDFQSINQFRRNPLYRYAYRHLDSYYQAAESIGTYGGFNLSMTYYRRLYDFTQRERAILHLLNRRLDTVAGELHRHEILQTRLNDLCRLSKSAHQTFSELTSGELRLLTGMIRGEPVPRDTAARLRQKLNLKTSKQLTAWLAETTHSFGVPQPSRQHDGVKVSREKLKIIDL